MQDYKRFRVIARTRDVIRLTYRFTQRFPREEQFGLTAQMRRAAVSIGLNIAEGAGRGSRRELVRFLWIARGSAVELDFAMVVSADLDYGQSAERELVAAKLEILLRQLTALIATVKSRI
jgi:four helix bundle protein